MTNLPLSLQLQEDSAASVRMKDSFWLVFFEIMRNLNYWL